MQNHIATRAVRRAPLRLLIAAALALSIGCSGLAGAQSTQSPSPDPGATATPEIDEDLFAAEPPTMHPISGQAETDGEFVVPDSCRPTEAGVRHEGDGFLLVVRFQGDVPGIDTPPDLPFGNILVMHEFNLGLFAPEVDPELGGGYHHLRQYQVRDRPANAVVRLGSGESEPLENVDVDVRGNEVRLDVPNLGADTERVTEWGLTVTCVLRHPVDKLYFPTTRTPAERFARLPVG